MYFTDFEERLFGSRAKVKVLRYLVRNADRRQIGFDIAKLLHLSPTQVLSILKEFEDANLVHHLLVGRAKAWEVDRASLAYERASELLAYEKDVRSRLWLILAARGIEKGKNGIRELLLFGSVAKKTEAPDSDIDVLIIVKAKKDAERIAKRLEDAGKDVRVIFGNRLSPLVCTGKEFETGLKGGRPPFNEMKMNGGAYGPFLRNIESKRMRG